METQRQQQRNLAQQQRGCHCSGSGRSRGPGVGCMPQPGTCYMSQHPALPRAPAVHLVLPPLACDPVSKRSESVVPCKFSLLLSCPASSRNNETPRRKGSGKRNERLVVLCKDRDEEINNLHCSQDGVKGKQSRSGQQGFSWLQQSPPGVIY